MDFVIAETGTKAFIPPKGVGAFSDEEDYYDEKKISRLVYGGGDGVFSSGRMRGFRMNFPRCGRVFRGGREFFS